MLQQRLEKELDLGKCEGADWPLPAATSQQQDAAVMQHDLLNPMDVEDATIGFRFFQRVPVGAPLLLNAPRPVPKTSYHKKKRKARDVGTEDGNGSSSTDSISSMDRHHRFARAAVEPAALLLGAAQAAERARAHVVGIAEHDNSSSDENTARLRLKIAITAVAAAGGNCVGAAGNKVNGSKRQDHPPSSDGISQERKKRKKKKKKKQLHDPE